MNSNTWIDLPIVEAIEYFSGVIGQAYKWATRYALLFGLLGIIWSGYKVMMSRMTVKDLWWDTLFKWIGFILLMTLYPGLSIAFSSIGNQIGLNAGGGKEAIIEGLTNLRNTIKQDLKTQERWANGLESDLTTKIEGLTLTTDFKNSSSYADYLNRVSDEIDAYKFDSGKDKKAAQQLVKNYKDKAKYTIMFGAQTLSALERVLIEREMDGTKGDDLTNTYVDLDIFLRNAEGNQTYYISPSALLKVSLLSCQIMWEKENTIFNKISDDISSDEDLGVFDKAAAQLAHQFSRIWQMLQVVLCCIVLILATIFAEIQYVMTILEYTMVAGIGAIFIPLMLFDGTKDIPKKLIPVFISFLVKIMVITICIMFVYYTIIENCIHTIADDAGMNWTSVGEIFFEAILCYVLTQNAPQIADTILTGQPKLSMGEFVAGAGTALATAGGMKNVATGAARTAYNKGSDAIGGAKKMKAAAQAASGSLGEGASKGQKLKAAIGGAGAVASADLKDKMKAKAEKFSKGHSSIPVLDKVMQTSGLSSSSGGGGVGGSGSGGASAHQMTGQDKEGNPLSNTSNPNFATATKFDEKTGGQRSMTHKEFNREKTRQGDEIGIQYGKKMKAKQEAKEAKRKTKEAKKAEQNNSSLPENITGNERAFEG